MTNGLDDVVAAETVLSEVDGEAGRLVIRGCALEELVREPTFEAAVARMFDGFFSGLPAAQELSLALGRAREQVYAIVRDAHERLFDLPAAEAVRALTAGLRDEDDLAAALMLVAAPAVFTAAVHRRRSGLALVTPDAAMDHATDALRMAGLEASQASAAALRTYLLTVVDHGLNASTFAARVVASTRAGLTSSVLAGLSALKGPLHGGAPGPVLDMLDAIGAPERAPSWLDDEVARGGRLMGFGHRVYRVRDPRADALKDALDALRRSGRVPRGRWSVAQATEQAALEVLQRRKPGRRLQTNVEFYTALLLDALGFDREDFTCVFAMGRVVGWIAHAREQQATGRLIRPRSRYVGPAAMWPPPASVAEEKRAGL